jgi:hypothetical protein
VFGRPSWSYNVQPHHLWRSEIHHTNSLERKGIWQENTKVLLVSL